MTSQFTVTSKFIDVQFLLSVDDTFCVIKSAYIDEFTDHINNQDRNIKFTREEEEDGTLPFLDTVINKLDDGGVKNKDL